MIYASIDYSMTSPVISVYDDSKEFLFQNLTVHNRTSKKKLVGTHNDNIQVSLIEDYDSNEERFYQSGEWAKKILLEHKVEKVFIEGYAMGASKGLVFNIAENTSVLKQIMWSNNIQFVEFAPTSIKKFFSGKGNAKKPEMIEAFKNKTGVDLQTIFGNNKVDDKPADDIVDSYAIMEMGLKNG